ncbi:hypothetical protein CEXT_121831 [Caerostris extrusa]|uniref:Uncharacterized protein n=1 Tax=Caerostris extrusa TaxID=172846 RepID=A0AAV4SFE0_CAEEX|nr:hypothetical protein CEXT_121831 [Caerostris extrusa]
MQMKGDRREVNSDARFRPADYLIWEKSPNTNFGFCPCSGGCLGNRRYRGGEGVGREIKSIHRQDVRAEILQSGEMTKFLFRLSKCICLPPGTAVGSGILIKTDFDLQMKASIAYSVQGLNATEYLCSESALKAPTRRWNLLKMDEREFLGDGCLEFWTWIWVSTEREKSVCYMIIWVKRERLSGVCMVKEMFALTKIVEVSKIYFRQPNL